MLEFSRAFKDADEVIVTEVYASRANSRKISHSWRDHPAGCRITPRSASRLLDSVTKYLLENLKPRRLFVLISSVAEDNAKQNLQRFGKIKG
ncbi:MAG: hypothetical protein U0V48_10110 [Anaerolineales bacterium]